MKEAFEQAVVGMFGYMTDLDKVDIEQTVEVEAEGMTSSMSSPPPPILS